MLHGERIFTLKPWVFKTTYHIIPLSPLNVLFYFNSCHHHNSEHQMELCLHVCTHWVCSPGVCRLISVRVLCECLGLSVCVCVWCGRSVWQVHCSVEEVRLAHTDMRQLSLPPRPCTIQPRLTVSCLTHGLGLMHMEEGSERENKNNNYPCLCACMCVCGFHTSLCSPITVNHLKENGCLPSCVSLSEINLFLSPLSLSSILLSSSILSSANPSIFLHDSGHDRDLPLPDPSVKRAPCHVSLSDVYFSNLPPFLWKYVHLQNVELNSKLGIIVIWY